ncbi:zinc transport system substrate-binding protein [Caldanaerovirga acetigignens]|uniref:Zinc transport system substrate-binding protein n=1 Tax=Caldanaerovirga acetigignens TaxID=447595 RepID=A0A1M7GWL8_9FIRM|nr:metal ABC transporter substrate-binding protein [Caldanaerovirga acetigignens]SHM20645.1 zinc transport system substrate-binding protein [Caldanaerovirga acetigignens]
MRRRVIYSLLAVLMAVIFLINGCTTKASRLTPHEGGKIRIYTTIYPLYDFAVKIAGDKASVQKIVPAGVEVHDFEPSPKLVAGIYDADVFIYLGGSIDPWAEKLAVQLLKEGVTVVKAGEGLFQEELHEDEEGVTEGNGQHLDPHVWLDPILAKTLAERIAEAMAATDGKNEAYYRKNLEDLKKRLDDLDEKYRNSLLSTSKRDFVVNHAAFGYMAKRYNLNQIAISGLSPQQEPSPKKLAELAKLCKERDIRYIMVEAASSSKLAEVLAKETGNKVLVLHPLENLTDEDIRAGKDYFSIMLENLENLKRALNE